MTKKKNKTATPAVAESTVVAPTQLPELDPKFVPLKDVVLKLAEALEQKSVMKFAGAAGNFMAVVVELGGSGPEAEVEKNLEELELPAEFFAHLPGKLRAAAALKLVESFMDDAKETFKA